MFRGETYIFLINEFSKYKTSSVEKVKNRARLSEFASLLESKTILKLEFGMYPYIQKDCKIVSRVINKTSFKNQEKSLSTNKLIYYCLRHLTNYAINYLSESFASIFILHTSSQSIKSNKVVKV